MKYHHGMNHFLRAQEHYAFLAYPASGFVNVTGDGTTYTIAFDTEAFDYGSNFNTTTGQFVAPADGIYCFRYNITLDGITGSHGTYFIRADIAGTAFLMESGNAANVGAGGRLGSSGSCIMEMNATDTASIAINVASSTKVVDVAASTLGGQMRTSFSGYKLHG